MVAAELTGVPATAPADLVAHRAASAEEVVAAHVARIEAVDTAINAVVALDAERPLAAARAADAARARGEPCGPLHGVPFTAMDNLEAEGLPIGVQLVARPWGDHVALAAARHLERELAGFRPGPTATFAAASQSTASARPMAR
jgi:Asp-tRNA(Asn)/Glu-tRNA(Gln) amidotransferase A subunit family amidase